MFYADENQKKAREEMRVFNAVDLVWAVLIGLAISFVSVPILAYFGAFEGALIEGWLGELDLRSLAKGASYFGVFLMGFMGTLMFRKR